MNIAITGIGAITALGGDPWSSFDALCRGETAVHSVGPFPGRGPVAAIDGGPHRTSDLAIDACRQALGDTDPAGVGLVGGSTSGDMVCGEVEYGAWLKGRPTGPDYLWAQLCDRPTQRVASALGICGPRLSVSTACTSGAVAIGIAARWISSGRVQRAVAFGADALCGLTVSGFSSLGAMSETGCEPFAEPASGLSLGEAAGALVLEPLHHAIERDAPIYAVIRGYGNTCDAHHMTAPEPHGRGALRAISQAISQSPLCKLDYINAHGTGTQHNDAMERAVLARCAPGAAVSSIKGAIGHTLGAAGAVEALFTALALHTGRVPPNRGGICGQLDLVGTTRRAPLQAALSVNFAFSGHNTALLMRRDPR